MEELKNLRPIPGKINEKSLEILGYTVPDKKELLELSPKSFDPSKLGTVVKDYQNTAKPLKFE